jgi:hypothetical protein
VVRNHLLLRGERQILQTSVSLLQVDVAETTIKQNLAGVKLELQAELLVVDVVVAAQVQEGVVEVCKRLLEVAHEEVGYALLEVCDGEVLVQTHSALVAVDLECMSTRSHAHRAELVVTYRLLVLAECRMDDTAVEQNLGSVRDAVKDLQCLVELVVVVAGEGCHPGFDFLPAVSTGLGRKAHSGAEGRRAPASET